MLLSIVNISLGYTQISPGDLTTSHAELEGMTNCTQCHDLGTKVSDAKCLECHTVIQSLMDQKRGFHASKEVVEKNCFDCHSEHHGRKFDMVRFDEDEFDHLSTGYELVDAHAVIDCRACHEPDNIEHQELKLNPNTFLGLGQECLSCHDDFHQQTLSNDCNSCHDIIAFRPAPGFDHNDTDYKLSGAHLSVECVDCHKMTTQNGKEFQQFSYTSQQLSFSDCVSCHNDPHNNQLNNRCNTCHTEQTFSQFIGQYSFDHSRTSFTLRGSHERVDCFSCHESYSDPLTIFQDQLGVDESACVSCHEDFHEGRFGTSCTDCHNEESFSSVSNLDQFDHDLTDFPLTGLHEGVDCRSCHSSKYTDPVNFDECKNCHTDYHEGEFNFQGQSPDCIDCHTIEESFSSTTYTFERHQDASFPLEGSHLATPCFACHLTEDRWSFRDIGSSCIDCHSDEHQGFISKRYYPEQDCATCHNPKLWSQVEFEHAQTDWSLEGGHIEVNCRVCHYRSEEGSNNFIQLFNGLSHECTTCHEDSHDEQFNIEGVTDCTTCHNVETWNPIHFDHDQTQFPLEGKHAEIDCSSCHHNYNNGERDITLYKLEKFECIDCHL